MKPKPAARGPPRSQGPVAADACYRCGKTEHSPHRCYYRESVCRGCGRTGHILASCKAMKKTTNAMSQRRTTQRAGAEPIGRSQRGQPNVHSLDNDEYEVDIAAVHTSETTMNTGKLPKDAIAVNPIVNGQSITMELDTGSPVSIVPVSIFKDLVNDLELQPTKIQLRTYSGQRLRTLGKARVDVQVSGQRAQDDLYVVDTSGPPLFSRTWLRKLRLDWNAIHSVRTTSASDCLNQLKESYADIFKTDLGCLHYSSRNLWATYGEPLRSPYVPHTFPICLTYGENFKNNQIICGPYVV